MSNTVVMKNEISAKKQAKVQYSLEDEIYFFETNIEGDGEYALIFVNDDNSYYTAAVTQAGKTLMLKIDKKKIGASVKIKIVDINTDNEIFCCPFIVTAKKADEPETASAHAAEKNEEKPRIHIMEKANYIKQMEKKYFTKQPPSFYYDACKKQFDQYFQTFTAYENILTAHTLYIYDEALSMEHEMHLMLNKGVVPLSKLYLHYINRYLPEGVALPRRIVGTAVIEGEEYYVFGTLGAHLREQQPFTGATGFVYHYTFDEGLYGYWLMYINAKTGKIATPLTPVNVW